MTATETHYSVECSNRSESGVCRIVTEMLGRDYVPDPRGCVHCNSAKPPKDINSITVGMARARQLVEGREPTERLKKNYHHVIGRQVHTSGGGPGTELKKMIPDFFEHKGCSCKEYAAKMDSWGVAGCESRFNEIVQHLVEESEKLGHGLGIAAKVVPVSIRRAAAGKLVAKAIEKARGRHSEKA